MTDHLTPSHRSWNMAQIHSSDTKPEKIVRSMLFAAGFRFRINRKDLPGKPDIVLPKFKTVIFIHGCFWHRHKGCRDASMPKSNTDFWHNKFEANVKRDERVGGELKALGWKVVTIWECQVKKEDVLKKIIDKEFGSMLLNETVAAEKSPVYKGIKNKAVKK